MNDTVSVIIPTHNRAQLLDRALLSVTGQTLSPDEIIVVDDGSTDHTGRLVAEKYPTVRYVRQAHRGVSAARNEGIRHASGRWLAFLDSDDEWFPAKLETQFHSLASSPELKICHTEEIWVRNGRRVNPGQRHVKAGGWIFQNCLPLCAMSPSSILLHRLVLDQVGGFDESLPACEDYDLWLRITARYPVLFVGKPLIVKYGGHEDQLSRKFWGMDRFRIRSLVKVLEGVALRPRDRRAAHEMLVKKIGVYLGGARKRKKQQEIPYYQDLLERFSGVP